MSLEIDWKALQADGWRLLVHTWAELEDDTRDAWRTFVRDVFASGAAVVIAKLDAAAETMAEDTKSATQAGAEPTEPRNRPSPSAHTWNIRLRDAIALGPDPVAKWIAAPNAITIICGAWCHEDAVNKLREAAGLPVLPITREGDCETCHGSGVDWQAITCRDCGGSGDPERPGEPGAAPEEPDAAPRTPAADRDETKPPPGWRKSGRDYVRDDRYPLGAVNLAEAWAIYDREHAQSTPADRTPSEDETRRALAEARAEVARDNAEIASVRAEVERLTTELRDYDEAAGTIESALRERVRELEAALQSIREHICQVSGDAAVFLMCSRALASTPAPAEPAAQNIDDLERENRVWVAKEVEKELRERVRELEAALRRALVASADDYEVWDEVRRLLASTPAPAEHTPPSSGAEPASRHVAVDPWHQGDEWMSGPQEPFAEVRAACTTLDVAIGRSSAQAGGEQVAAGDDPETLRVARGPTSADPSSPAVPEQRAEAGPVSPPAEAVSGATTTEARVKELEEALRAERKNSCWFSASLTKIEIEAGRQAWSPETAWMSDPFGVAAHRYGEEEAFKMFAGPSCGDARTRQRTDLAGRRGGS